MDQLKARFPDGLTYNVFFDTTVFVTATVAEVVRTLAIAFVLVAGLVAGAITSKPLVRLSAAAA